MGCLIFDNKYEMTQTGLQKPQMQEAIVSTGITMADDVEREFLPNTDSWRTVCRLECHGATQIVDPPGNLGDIESSLRKVRRLLRLIRVVVRHEFLELL